MLRIYPEFLFYLWCPIQFQPFCRSSSLPLSPSLKHNFFLHFLKPLPQMLEFCWLATVNFSFVTLPFLSDGLLDFFGLKLMRHQMTSLSSLARILRAHILLVVNTICCPWMYTFFIICKSQTSIYILFKNFFATDTDFWSHRWNEVMKSIILLFHKCFHQLSS